MEHFLYDAHTIPNIYTHFFKSLYDSLRGFHFIAPFFKGSKRGSILDPPLQDTLNSNIALEVKVYPILGNT